MAGLAEDADVPLEQLLAAYGVPLEARPMPPSTTAAAAPRAEPSLSEAGRAASTAAAQPAEDVTADGREAESRLAQEGFGLADRAPDREAADDEDGGGGACVGRGQEKGFACCAGAAACVCRGGQAGDVGAPCLLGLSS